MGNFCPPGSGGSTDLIESGSNSDPQPWYQDAAENMMDDEDIFMAQDIPTRSVSRWSQRNVYSTIPGISIRNFFGTIF